MERRWGGPPAPLQLGGAGGAQAQACRGAGGAGGNTAQSLIVGPAIEGMLGSMMCAFDRIASLSASACGGCQKDLHSHRRQMQQDPSLAHVFVVKPLAECGMEAARATQRGARLVHEGRPDEALRELHDARQLAPNSHEACCNLGCVYHLSGDDNAGLHWYREARRLFPRGETAVLAQAFLEQRKGFPEEAVRILVGFLQEVDSSHVGALRQLGKLHIREDQWSKAAGVYHKLIAVDPTSDEWPSQLQLCLNHLPVKNDFGEPVLNPGGGGIGGMFALAFSMAEPMLRSTVDPKEGRSTNAFATLGGAGGGGHSPRNCRASTEDGYGAGGERGPGRGAGPPAGLQRLREAKQLLEAGRAEAAIPLYEGLLRQDPRSGEALLGLAECHADAGRLDAALEAGKQLLGVRPDDAEANLRVAELLLSAGYSAEMVEPYLKWAGNVPNGGRTLRLRMLCAQAQIALLREDYAKANASASEAVRIDAEAPKALLLLGHARLRVAEYAAALRALNAASSTAGARSRGGEARRLRATAHTLAAEAHERQRQYPQALQEVQRALELAPGLPQARVVRATALQQSGRDREAESELEDLLQTEPSNAAARLQLGYGQLCAGDPRAAATLEGILSGPAVGRSTLGAAKAYLAVALEVQAERSYDRGALQRAEMLAKESLAQHRNLQQVWRGIEGGPAQPVEALQRLRGICDLDLTTVQAKQLLKLLARAHGRSELARGGGSSGAATPLRSTGGSAMSRDSSVPPNRWAPMGGVGGVGRGSFSGVSTPIGTHGANTPVGTGCQTQWHAHGASAPATPQQGYRGRSVSPSPAYNEPRGRRDSRDSSPLPRSSPGEGGGRNDLTIGWNELIIPEQLVFGPQLGAGGSAQVFRGSWNGQEVAIKKISGVAHLEEMKKEINALRRLRHPRLVRFIGACVQPPLLLVVTEFMPGGSLHDVLFGARRDQPLAFAQRWTIACQMAEGLSFLHSQRHVHRDMKSMNILLDAQSNAKICDFGLAHQMTDMATHIARKIDGEEGGSPRYMAPECYDAAHGKITEKVDVWAMGCILIELFGGVLPYGDCQTMAQLSKRILMERRSPDVPTSIQGGFQPLIRNCLAFDPNRRLSAEQLQHELGRLRP